MTAKNIEGEEVTPESRLYCPACTYDLLHGTGAVNGLIHGLDASLSCDWDDVSVGMTACTLPAVVLMVLDLCVDTGYYEPDRIASLRVLAVLSAVVVGETNVLMTENTFDTVVLTMSEFTEGMLATDRTKSVDDGLGDTAVWSHEVVGMKVKVMSYAGGMSDGRMACEMNMSE